MENQIVKYDKTQLARPIQRVSTVRSMLTSFESDLEKLIPVWSGVKFDRIRATAIQVISESPTLLRCNGKSILTAITLGCEFGLDFAKVFGRAYIVPYKGQCQLQIGYRGWLDLVRRAAAVDMIDAIAVYEGDVFIPTLGTETRIVHEPNMNVPRDAEHLMHVYCVAHHKSGLKQVVIMSKGEVDEIRKTSKSWQRSGTSSVWGKWYVQMSLKTVIRRIVKYLPMSTDKTDLLEKALIHDNKVDGFVEGTIVEADPQAKLENLKAKIGDEPAAPPEAPEAPLEYTPDGEVIPNNVGGEQ